MMKRNRCIIVTAILFAVLIMSVGYATFATKLTINGTAEIVGNWNIKIVGIEAIEVSEGADPGTPEYTDTTATFYAKLKKPEDKITYLITIENAGTLDAKLLDATFNCEEDEKQKILLAVVVVVLDDMLLLFV